MDMSNVARCIEAWPGKSAGENGIEHPALYHMLDVAAVAEVLLAESSLPKPWKDAFILLVALHDLGKIGAGFRGMIRDRVSQQFRHWELSEAWLAESAFLKSRLNGNPHVYLKLVAAIAGHHGRPSALGDTLFPTYCKNSGNEAAGDIPVAIEALAALWPQASLEGMRRKEATHLGWWLAGLTTAADWIGSKAEWFVPQPAGMSLDDYLAHARRVARQAVPESGIAPARVRSDRLFDFSLRPMQEAVSETELPEGPMLAFIEDETGAGKTEAALILAQRMLLAGKGQGLFFALPTMATADAMFERARNVVGRMLTEPSVTLAHSRAGLSASFREVQQGKASKSDDIVCTDWLADNRRRALLANVGVGTIDQALLSILKTRFSALRLWGLSSKILIVDEAHEIANVGYEGRLLQELLSVHAAQGGSAIVLTATLPLGARARLMQSFATGAGKDWPEVKNRAYPALTIPGASERSVPAQTSPKGAVQVKRLSQADEAVELLVESVAKGAACVWIRNAVDDAIAAVELLEKRGIAASLLHARFTLFDRKRIEASELARFGKNGSNRAGRVLVGTQVLESSLDLDFDVMISDLAPMAALIQRAGRLWRHMKERPQKTRPVAEPVLHVLSPDPSRVQDEKWLHEVLDRGAWIYPVADQWRTAEHLFSVGEIRAPEGLRDLIEAVHGAEALPEPSVLEKAEAERQGEGYAARGWAEHNIIGYAEGYRSGAKGPDDTSYPTRLGRETRTLALARMRDGVLQPWAQDETVSQDDLWQLSEVRADKKHLDRLPLPDQTQPAIAAILQDWPEWKRTLVTICPVDDEGEICEGLLYDKERGLVWSPSDV